MDVSKVQRGKKSYYFCVKCFLKIFLYNTKKLLPLIIFEALKCLCEIPMYILYTYNMIFMYLIVIENLIKWKKREKNNLQTFNNF